MPTLKKTGIARYHSNKLLLERSAWSKIKYMLGLYSLMLYSPQLNGQGVVCLNRMTDEELSRRGGTIVVDIFGV